MGLSCGTPAPCRKVVSGSGWVIKAFSRANCMVGAAPCNPGVYPARALLLSRSLQAMRWPMVVNLPALLRCSPLTN